MIELGIRKHVQDWRFADGKVHKIYFLSIKEYVYYMILFIIGMEFPYVEITYDTNVFTCVPVRTYYDYYWEMRRHNYYMFRGIRDKKINKEHNFKKKFWTIFY